MSLRVRFARATLSAQRVNELVELHHLAARALQGRPTRPAGPPGERSAPSLPLLRPLRRRRALVRTRAHWRPRSSARFSTPCGRPSPPRALVRDLLASPTSSSATPADCSQPSEWPLLLRTRQPASSGTTWSFDDLALLDEAAFLTGGRTRSYGHIVVDEAQDLTPMQFRMIARRAPSGSVTILGDLAQATGPWSYGDWSEVRDILGARFGAATSTPSSPWVTGRRDGCSTSPRGCFPSRRPACAPTSSIRQGRTEPTIRSVPSERSRQRLAGRGLRVDGRPRADCRDRARRDWCPTSCGSLDATTRSACSNETP